MLLTPFADSLKTLQKADSAVHIENIIRVLRNVYFGINLIKIKVGNAEVCYVIGTKLI